MPLILALTEFPQTFKNLRLRSNFAGQESAKNDAHDRVHMIASIAARNRASPRTSPVPASYLGFFIMCYLGSRLIGNRVL
jgi:hypothetical protein